MHWLCKTIGHKRKTETLYFEQPPIYEGEIDNGYEVKIGGLAEYKVERCSRCGMFLSSFKPCQTA